jgi:nucleoside-diphosphate-sugar epimerase
MLKLKVAILGSDGSAGAAIADEFLERGHEVLGINKTGKDKFDRAFDTKKVDILNYNLLLEATQESDLVIAAYYPIGYSLKTWSAEYPIFVKNLIELGKSGKRIIFVDSFDGLGQLNANPISEQTPYKPNSPKSQIRGYVSTTFEKALKENLIQASIVKSSSLFGPYATRSIFGSIFFKQLFLNRKNIQLLPTKGFPFSFTYTRDLAEAVAIIAENPSVDGNIFVLPSMQPASISEFAELIIDESKVASKISSMPNWLFKIKVFLDPYIRLANEKQYLHKSALLVDSTKFFQFFPNYSQATNQEAIKETVNWFKRYLK